MIIRTQHNKDNPYVQINRKSLEDQRLSFKATGVLAYLLSRPDNWQTHVDQLIKSHQDGETSVRSAIAELIELSYIERTRIIDGKGRVQRWEYIVKESPDVECPDMENPNVEEGNMENPSLENGNPIINNNDIKNNKNKNKQKNGQAKTDHSLSFFSDLEPDSEPPTENPPLLVKPEIKSEDQPISGNQVSEADHDLSVTSGKEDPPLPPPRRNEGKTSTDEDLRFDKKIPFPGDINNSCYGQELARRRFDLPEEIARGTGVVLKDKFGRHLLCMLNAEGLDLIANLPNFLKYYHAQHLIGHPLYKDKPFGDVIQSMTARAITSKIKDDDTGVLIQTILDFKKKIAKAAQPTPQPRSLEPLPERGDCVLPDMSSVFESNKKRLEEQIKRNKEKRIKTAANSKKDISTISDPLLAAEAKLTQNPETFASDYDF